MRRRSPPLTPLTGVRLVAAQSPEPGSKWGHLRVVPEQAPTPAELALQELRATSLAFASFAAVVDASASGDVMDELRRRWSLAREAVVRFDADADAEDASGPVPAW